MEFTNCISIPSEKQKQKQYVYIPADIIHGVLLKLPAKSLMRFRCVSKMFCNIIDSVSFPTLHELACSEEPQILHSPIFMAVVKKLHSLTYNVCNSVMKKSESPVFEFAETNEKNDYQLCHVAYGLLCFRCFRSHPLELIFLFNPLKGEVLELPGATGELWTSEKFGVTKIAFFGMGFDSTTNTYKVVRVYRTIGFGAPYATEVHSLGRDSSWRRISSVPPCCLNFTGANGVTAYGDMHWMRYEHEEELKLSRTKKIVSFDFKSEEFRWTSHPDWGCKGISLMNLRGALAIVVGISSDTALEIWVLKDYGKKNSYWVREFNLGCGIISPDDLSPRYFFLRAYNCFGAWGDGRLFLDSHRHEHYVIDLKTNNIHYINQCPLQEDYDYHPYYPDVGLCIRAVYNYTESVISLRKFGCPIADHRYNFIKTARDVYVSGPME